jgi:glutamate 5-kinase
VVEADLLIILSDVKGLYTADPRIDPSATFIPRVERVDAAITALAAPHRSATSRGGMATKLEAARLATASGTSVVICDGREERVVERLVVGEPVGTFFPATTSRLEARRRRMLALPPRGDLVVDDGASRALREGGKSLLPVGVKEVRGKFERGDVVYITDRTGNRFAVGIAHYGSAEAARLKGVHSAKITAVLGEDVSYPEIVHRDNMVLL